MPFQPGAILHDAIMGAFRARGWSFEGWLIENGIKPASARGCTFGQSKGPKGKAMLNRARSPGSRSAPHLRRLRIEVAAAAPRDGRIGDVRATLRPSCRARPRPGFQSG